MSTLAYLSCVNADGALGRCLTGATEQDPGYIKGYPPGIRENGGQYTHTARFGR